MWLSRALLFEHPQPLDLGTCLRICIDACATCEAECLACSELRVQRCGLACAHLRERCRRLLESIRVASRPRENRAALEASAHRDK
jgi:hypothetical protein